MRTVKISEQNGSISMHSHHEFTVSEDVYFHQDLTPSREVKFHWNVQIEDLLEDQADAEKREEVLQMAGEKLKQDFISFLKSSVSAT